MANNSEDTNALCWEWFTESFLWTKEKHRHFFGKVMEINTIDEISHREIHVSETCSFEINSSAEYRDQKLCEDRTKIFHWFLKMHKSIKGLEGIGKLINLNV